MATRANLIDTYNSNPTLQSRYTLQEYLNLFGFGVTTTPTTPPTQTPPTQTPATPGIPNIINQNLNQGGGGDGGPQGIATPSTTLQKTYDPTKELSVGEYFSGVEGSPIYTSTYTERKDPIEGLIDLYQKFSPIGMIGRKIERDREFKEAQTNKALEQVAMQQAIREAEEAERARQNAVTYQYNNPSQPGSGSPDDRSDAFRGGGANVPQTDYTSTGRVGYSYGLADGGRVYLYNRLK